MTQCESVIGLKVPAATFEALVEQTELLRLDAGGRLDPKRRVELGQFFTPSGLATFMARMFRDSRPSVRLLDAGSGVGSLTAAFVADMCRRPTKPQEIFVTAYELDADLIPYLNETMQSCAHLCESAGVDFSWEVIQEDFIAGGIDALAGNLFTGKIHEPYNYAIMNPPYKKIQSSSRTRTLLRTIGVETSNLYTAFLSVAMRMLEKTAELVAITPRSFCNGPYFRPFREQFLRDMTFTRIHAFESRSRAFSEDDVLQENIIFHAVKGLRREGQPVTISSSDAPKDDDITVNEVHYDQLVLPNDPQLFIHLVKNDVDKQAGDRMRSLDASLSDLEVSVSTGRVVDFRAKEFLRSDPVDGTVPLIYPLNFSEGYVTWPKPSGKKSSAIVDCPETDGLMVPSGTYVLVKRLTSKEETRRVVAAIFDPTVIPAPNVGFENHLNYYHRKGAGLPPALAMGLAVFLNCTLVDSYFRQFNGHTQVNATDLKNLRYPAQSQLERLGSLVGTTFPDQSEIDRWIEEVLFPPLEDTSRASGVSRSQSMVAGSR